MGDAMQAAQRSGLRIYGPPPTATWGVVCMCLGVGWGVLYKADGTPAGVSVGN